MSKFTDALHKLISHAAPEAAATKGLLDEVATQLSAAAVDVLKVHEDAIVERVKGLLDSIEADLRQELANAFTATARKAAESKPVPAETPVEAPQAASEAPKASK